MKRFPEFLARRSDAEVALLALGATVFVAVVVLGLATVGTGEWTLLALAFAVFAVHAWERRRRRA